MTKPTSRKAGRPRFEPSARDRAAVKKLSAAGVSQLEIARTLGVAATTLRRHFADELARGAIEANAAVATSLFRMAVHRTRPNVRAAIFWLKSRAGWRDHDGPPAEPPAPKPAPLGKKAQANLDAQTVHLGTSWEDLLGPDDPDEKTSLQ